MWLPMSRESRNFANYSNSAPAAPLEKLRQRRKYHQPESVDDIMILYWANYVLRSSLIAYNGLFIRYRTCNCLESAERERERERRTTTTNGQTR